MNIQNDVLDILKRATITDRSVALPEGQLDPALYQRVKKVLIAAGGKWNRFKWAFLFADDPRPKLGIALENGTIKSKKNELQAFFTPREIADEVALLANVAGCTVLEPSAGHGALVEACARQGCRSVKCIDIEPEYCGKLTADGLTGVICGDFLKVPVPPNRQFDRVVMNPPFTKNQDIAHVRHALNFVAPGGRLVASMAANIDRPWFKTDVAKSATIKELPAGSFKESGTNIRTIIVSIQC